jgi:Kef-type K+ transport system membrane component KefB
MQLRKILGILTIVLFLVSAIIVVMFYMNVVPLSNPQEQMDNSITDTFIGWAYILFFVCAILAFLVFPLWSFVQQIIDNPKSVVKTLVVIAAVALVCIIAYALADGSFDSITSTTVETNENELKWSGAGLNALYISLGVAVLAVIYAEVAKKFN